MRKTILTLAVIVGVAAMLSGLAAGAGFMLLRILAGSDLLTNTLGWALAAAGMGLGLLLAVNGWRALAGRPGRRLYVPWWGWWLLAFVLVLIGGQLLLSAGSEFLAPLFHVSAAVVPPIMYLALAAGAVRKAERPVRLSQGPVSSGNRGYGEQGTVFQAAEVTSLAMDGDVPAHSASEDAELLVTDGHVPARSASEDAERLVTHGHVPARSASEDAERLVTDGHVPARSASEGAGLLVTHGQSDDLSASGGAQLLVAPRRASRFLIPARSTWGSLAWGGLGGVGLGFFIEALALVALVVVASIWLSAARPDLLAQLQAFAENMQRGGGMPDLEQLAWLRSPLVVLGVLLFASVFVPVVEELAKSLAVPLVGLTGHRLSRLDGFLLGVAAGAGFALVEGMFNGALGLSQPEGWAGAMLTRGGASAMHCLASGLFGLGWQAVISERRYGRGVGLAALSVLLHGLWNAGALGIGLSALTRPSVGFGALNLRDVQSVFIGGLLVTLWLLAVVTLAWLPRRLMEE